MRFSLAIVFVILGRALAAHAGDGILEINQTCAVETGCFPGDSPGFPVEIRTAGTSYRLTSPLIIADGNTDGIYILAGDVRIDLNGFSIRGPVVCSGAPTTCTPVTGSRGTGILEGGLLTGNAVENGSVIGMGDAGVRLAFQSEVTNVRTRWNGQIGIDTRDGAILSGNVACENGSHGIKAEIGAVITDNVVCLNGADGISTSSGAEISENTSYQNASSGITAGEGSTLTGNTAYQNGSHGITAATGATLSANTVRFNSGFGLNLFSESSYRANTVTNNASGPLTGAGAVNLGANHCAGPGTLSGTCP